MVESPDKVILLGDYFDGFGASRNFREETASFIRDNLDNAKYVFLLGEQDLQYLWPNSLTECDNFKQGVFTSVDEKLKDDVVKKFKWYFWLNEKILLTHAGLSNWWLNTLEVPTDKIHSWLRAEEKECWDRLLHNRLHWFFAPGFAANGKIPTGGPIWCGKSEYIPIPTINQIYGHVHTLKPRTCYVQAYNYGLGTEMEYYAVYDSESDVLEIKYYGNLLMKL